MPHIITFFLQDFLFGRLGTYSPSCTFTENFRNYFDDNFLDNFGANFKNNFLRQFWANFEFNLDDKFGTISVTIMNRTFLKKRICEVVLLWTILEFFRDSFGQF